MKNKKKYVSAWKIAAIFTDFKYILATKSAFGLYFVHFRVWVGHTASDFANLMGLSAQ